MTQTKNPAPEADPDESPEIENVDDFHQPTDDMDAMDALVEPAQSVASHEAATPPVRNRRVQTRYIAHWRAALVGKDAKYMGKTDNVSLSGVAIMCDVNLRTNQEFQVYLEIPVQLGKPPLIFQALGLVVHSMLSQQAFKIGVVFRFFEGDSENVLRKALASGTYRELFDQSTS